MPQVELLAEVSRPDPEPTVADTALSGTLTSERHDDQPAEHVGWALVHGEHAHSGGSGGLAPPDPAREGRRDHKGITRLQHERSVTTPHTPPPTPLVRAQCHTNHGRSAAESRPALRSVTAAVSGAFAGGRSVPAEHSAGRPLP
jgi:hypothetical protein